MYAVFRVHSCGSHVACEFWRLKLAFNDKLAYKVMHCYITNQNVGQCPTWWSPCWRQVAPSVQRRKVWLTPSTRCRAVTLPRRETRWNLQGCLKLPDGSQPLVGRSSLYCGDMWRTYRCLTSFFQIVDTCLSCEDIARQSCAMVPRWRFFATFLRPAFPASRVQQVSDLHLKFALRPHHVWKYGRQPIYGRWD